MNAAEREVMDEIARVLAMELEYAGSVAADSRLDACPALDSLGLTTLVVGLEDRFRIKLSDDNAGGVETFGDVARLVAREREEQGA